MGNFENFQFQRPSCISWLKLQRSMSYFHDKKSFLDLQVWKSGLGISPSKKVECRPGGHVVLILPIQMLMIIMLNSLTDLCGRNIRWLKVQWTFKLAACFSSKIERLLRGGGLKGSTLLSKSKLFSPLNKGVFINTLVGWVGKSVGQNFFRLKKKNNPGMRGDQKF